MRTVLLIAAGLAGLAAATPPARAQYYGSPNLGWGYRPYVPYYAYPYGYYPRPYYPPPPVVYTPGPLYRPSIVVPRRRAEGYAMRRVRGSVTYRHPRRALINPLLGPLPGNSFDRR